MYLCDYHLHSHNSADGKSTIMEMTAKAIAAGMKEIAVTDHFEPILGNEQYLSYKPGNYFAEMAKARILYNRELKIKCAVELGQPHLYPKYSRKLIESYPYDYVLGSVHRMKDNEDFGVIVYNAANVRAYCVKYLDELEALVQWNQFDCVGHLDLVKRYASKYNFKVSLLDYRERMEEILKAVIRNGKGIEVNTSGLRQSAGECLPDLDLIRFYRQLGGELITVGSDAHCARDVGKGIREALERITLAGFNFVTVYSGRQPSMVRISGKPSVYCPNQEPA